MATPHGILDAPSAWIARFLPLLPPGAPVLDVAAGGGRHTAFARAAGHPVTAVDRDTAGLARFAGDEGVSVLEADLEGAPWPLAGRTFGAVVVTNYLHRPLFPHLLAAIAPGGWLLYETFAAGNERFGKPSNPDFLLRPGELREAVRGTLTVIAYEHGEVSAPRPAMIQRIAARRAA
jgi:SAM-dependent methyltransferase